MKNKGLMVLGVVFFLVLDVSAYMVIRARPVYQAQTSNVSVKPLFIAGNMTFYQINRPVALVNSGYVPICVDERLAHRIVSLRPGGMSWSYQAGYQDAIRDVKALLNISFRQDFNNTNRSFFVGDIL
jgi:hypothetical protein